MDTLKNLRHVNTDADYDLSLKNPSNDDYGLVVVEFYTTWCPYCRDMAPYMRQFAESHPNTLFVKVNSEKCKNISGQYNLKGYPTFILYKNKNIVARFEGKDPLKLEREIKRYSSFAPGSEDGPTTSRAIDRAVVSVPAHNDISNISNFLDRKNCRCFNDLAVSSFQSFLEGSKLTSGHGVGKLMMVYVFNQPMLLHQFNIKAPKHAAPKTLKFFTDQPMTLDFEDIALLKPAQEITLTENDLSGENKLDLSILNEKPLSVLHVLVSETSGHRRTELDSMNFFGMPIPTGDRPHKAKFIPAQ